MAKTLSTWSGISKFSYEGTVKTGTKITFGTGKHKIVSRSEYEKLISTFKGKVINIGTSRDKPPVGSLGEWLIINITKTAIASYVGPILIEEGYAEKMPGAYIKIFE